MGMAACGAKRPFVVWDKLAAGADVAKGNAAHYCMDYRTFDGFVFPTRRRVVSRAENEITATGGSSSVLIDIESVVVSFDGDTTRTADRLFARANLRGTLG
jgi:hypothetical protein